MALIKSDIGLILTQFLIMVDFERAHLCTRCPFAVRASRFRSTLKEDDLMCCTGTWKKSLCAKIFGYPGKMCPCNRFGPDKSRKMLTNWLVTNGFIDKEELV